MSLPLKSSVPSTFVQILTESDVKKHIPVLISWSSPDKSYDIQKHLVLEPITGGITNSIYRLTNNNGGDSVIVRIFGAPDVFDAEARHRETEIFEQLSIAGIAPCLRGKFLNGRVEQYIPAVPIDLLSMTEEVVGIGVARNLARLHMFRPTNDPNPPEIPPVWTLLEEWADTSVRYSLKGTFSDPESTISSYIKRTVAALPRLRQELQGGLVVYAHNDLLAGNILKGTHENNSITIIDFEYSGWNYQCFDIGNYFSEAMGGTQDAVIRTNLYPNIYFRNMFCTEYLRVLNSSSVPDPSCVKTLVDDAERYALLSHVYWGLWAIVQSANSSVSFAYDDYARQRLDLFFNKCQWA